MTTLKQYRIMDLTLLSVLAVATEAMGALLHLKLPGAGYYLSFAVLIGLIAVIRWGPIGGIVYTVSGIPMIFLGIGAVGFNILFYPIANSVLILVGYLFRKLPERKVIKDNLILLIFVTVAYCLIALAKGVVIGLYGENIFKGGVLYFLTQLFSMIMTYIVFLIIRRRDGLLMDMKTYFEREQEGHDSIS